MEEMKQRHFVLVHGAGLGAWCWYKVATLLKSAGHKVTALDMAASGVHPKQVSEIQSISDYFEPLMEFMMSSPQEEKVILVGHSFGGLSISIAMERFPEKISAAIFASAIMPGPDLSYTSAREKDLMLAMMLIRPHPLHNIAAVQNEAVLTKEKFGSVSRIFIVCGQDKVYSEDFQRWMVQKNPPNEIMVISDSDHMLMISRPQDFCSCLEDIAKKYF
ncbi:methylesterase 3 isoform X2 [Jatropha curcas]|uniref:methylesterase 3 isoform X2 n=1 Tax=Jatropha curcas TaxID=180498 RepID=UPI0005FAAC94|nr:methylesterase 3 isoform X2 [Jatropha curcas]